MQKSRGDEFWSKPARDMFTLLTTIGNYDRGEQLMKDYISIGSAPCDEECVQVNPHGDYHTAMKTECERFLGLIRATLGPEPPRARLAIKSNPHDFGTYYEVVCYYDDGDEEATAYAYKCESEAPRTWAKGG